MLPLVAGSDSGSENCNQHVECYFRENQVVHLRNLPRVPQHNPWVEHTWGELRGETGIESDTSGKGPGGRRGPPPRGAAPSRS
jgi:hypothetical protein